MKNDWVTSRLETRVGMSTPIVITNRLQTWSIARITILWCVSSNVFSISFELNIKHIFSCLRPRSAPSQTRNIEIDEDMLNRYLIIKISEYFWHVWEKISRYSLFEPSFKTFCNGPTMSIRVKDSHYPN